VLCQNRIDLLRSALLHGRGTFLLPDSERTLVRKLGVERLAIVTNGVLVLQIVARGTELINHIQSQCLLIDLDTTSHRTNEAKVVVAEHELLERALHACVHEGDIVDDVCAVQQRGHQADGCLEAGLLIQRLGVRGAAQAEYRQVVVLAHAGRYALLVSQHVVADHGLQVIGSAVPARHAHRGPLTHELRQDDAEEDPCIHGGHAAGRGHR